MCITTTATLHTDANNGATIQPEQAEAMSQAYMDIMNQMGMGPLLSAFSNATTGLSIPMYIANKVHYAPLYQCLVFIIPITIVMVSIGYDQQVVHNIYIYFVFIELSIFHLLSTIQVNLKKAGTVLCI